MIPRYMLHMDWLAEPRPEILRRLLPVATEALLAEDRRLAEAFEHAAHPNAGRNHGLAYWVFETTLVYEVFKSWLPLAHVESEYVYPNNAAEKADLVVFTNGRALVVEAKWWMSMNAKTLAALDADVKKILSWPAPAEARLLLTFWYSPNHPGQWQTDLAELRAFEPRCGRATPIYAAAFTTDQADTRDNVGSYLAMAALRIEPQLRSA